MKLQNIIVKTMHYNKIVLFITALLMIWGCLSLTKISKQEYPTSIIRKGIIICQYPGANVHDVEWKICKPFEDFLFKYKEINRKKTYTQIKDGVAYIYVDLNDDISNKDEVWAKIRLGIRDLEYQLPQGTLPPIVIDDFGATSAMLVTIESNNLNYRELDKYSDKLEYELRKLEEVSNIKRHGTQKEQLCLYFDRAKLDAYNIDIVSIRQILLSNNTTYKIGNIENENYSIPIHLTNQYKTESDILNQIISTNPQNTIFRIKDVADIKREYPTNKSYIENNGNKCILLSMEMHDGNNIIDFGKKVKKIINEFEDKTPNNVSINCVTDLSVVVDKAINSFLLEMLMAIISVILVTMILMPFRVASVAAVSIPITIFISLGIMYLFKLELNTVTLAALIVVLGLIVDDCIVIVDEYIDLIDKGMSRWHASINSANHYFKSLLSATLAISITFFPFIFTLTGVLNDFIISYPWTMTITLFVSLGIAMFIIPILQYFFIKKGLVKKKQIPQKTILNRLQSAYDKLLPILFEKYKIVLFVGFASIIIAGLLLTSIPKRLMPVAERDQFAIEVYLANGSSLTATAKVCDSLETILKKDKRIKNLTKFIGQSSPRFHATYAPKAPASNYGQFIVNTYTKEDTDDMMKEYADKYALFFPTAHIKFKQMDNQYSEIEIDIRIHSEEYDIMREFADSLMYRLKGNTDIIWCRTDFEQYQPSVDISVNSIKAYMQNVNNSVLTSGIKTNIEEQYLTTLWENDYPLNLYIVNKNKINDPVELKSANLKVSTNVLPINNITNLKYNWNENQIIHRNGERTIGVLVDLKYGKNSGNILPSIQTEILALLNNQKFSTIDISYGGVKESNMKNVPQIAKGLLISLSIIFLILLWHFKKISLAFLVLGSTVFCFFGAAFGLWITNKDLSITGIMGLVCLFGIVVRNEIILFDYAENLIKTKKIDVLNAIIEASRRRLRPIFLTSIAAAVGVVPMILSGSYLWSPMGTVICFGSFFSMVFIISLMPIIYWLIYKKRKL